MNQTRPYFYRCSQCGTRNKIPADHVGQIGRCGKCRHELQTADLLMAEPVMVTDRNFDNMVRHSPLPVLLFAWAPWCPSCSAMAPMIDAFAGEARGRLRVGKLNVDPNPQLATQFDIRSVPFLFIFDNGKMRESFPGGMDKHALMMKMAAYI